jgi:hypothetical protein
LPVTVTPDGDGGPVQAVGLLALWVIDHYLVLELGGQYLVGSCFWKVHHFTSFL